MPGTSGPATLNSGSATFEVRIRRVDVIADMLMRGMQEGRWKLLRRSERARRAWRVGRKRGVVKGREKHKAER
jgi:hypothetical protein